MSSKKEEAKVPTACIRKNPASRYTWCDRRSSDNEHLLSDAAHALKHYVHGTSFRACPNCVDVVTPVIQAGQYDSPPATRGLRNDR